MKTSVLAVLAGLLVMSNEMRAQSIVEPSAFVDPNLIATIFAPATPKALPSPSPRDYEDWSLASGFQKDFRARYRPPVPVDWEAFDKQYAPQQHPGRPSLQLLENGFYEVNQTLYSIKLFERKVNSLLNFEFRLNELGNYDSRSEQNMIDTAFSHATVRTDFNWDAPIGLFVGVRFQLRCDSIFQFWK